MPIKLVTQANLTDCGLACIAMVTGKSLDTVLRIAIKECAYLKDGPHTTTDENLFKLLDHFGIKYGKKQKVKTVEALPPLAIMETRKMPSTGNSHLVVFERTADGDEHALDPGWWLKQQIRSDWNRIKLDTFIPILYGDEPASKKATKATKTTTARKAVETQPETSTTDGEAKANESKKTAAKATAKKVKSAKRSSTETQAEQGGGETATALADEWSDNATPHDANDTGDTALTTNEGSSNAV